MDSWEILSICFMHVYRYTQLCRQLAAVDASASGTCIHKHASMDSWQLLSICFRHVYPHTPLCRQYVSKHMSDTRDLAATDVTQHDKDTARQFRAVLVMAMTHLTHVEARQGHCTPVQSRARNGDDAFNARGSVAPIALALLCLKQLQKRGNNLKVELRLCPNSPEVRTCAYLSPEVTSQVLSELQVTYASIQTLGLSGERVVSQERKYQWAMGNRGRTNLQSVVRGRGAQVRRLEECKLKRIRRRCEGVESLISGLRQKLKAQRLNGLTCFAIMHQVKTWRKRNEYGNNEMRYFQFAGKQCPIRVCELSLR
ncbi:hypothetical protein PR048_007321 [Dryococelus australis]|uniref:Uncharacterized protein n=1 Tax=Dryococelus australis TaxID=614101 RepID=A0ABQ9IDB1_9NEOP|nr:hypothetical protein PR048_007321 [Dryococelus australis]